MQDYVLPPDIHATLEKIIANPENKPFETLLKEINLVFDSYLDTLTGRQSGVLPLQGFTIR